MRCQRGEGVGGDCFGCHYPLLLFFFLLLLRFILYFRSCLGGMADKWIRLSRLGMLRLWHVRKPTLACERTVENSLWCNCPTAKNAENVNNEGFSMLKSGFQNCSCYHTSAKKHSWELRPCKHWSGRYIRQSHTKQAVTWGLFVLELLNRRPFWTSGLRSGSPQWK